MFQQEKTKIKKSLILLVEDDRKNVQVLGQLLAREEYEVAVAFDGSSANRFLDNHLPDLILLDVMMPVLNGFEFCRQVQSCDRYRGIPIIFITAKVEEADIVYGFNQGAVDYITKPFKSGELLARVRNHLDLKNAREELYEMTIVDELTSLYNRRHMKTELEQEIYRAVRYHLFFSMIIIDIDDFKKINDTFGHPEGDLALVRFASLSRECIRNTDTLGRIGGEEFCLLLPETTLNEAQVVAERIRAAIEERSGSPDGKVPPFTISLGLYSGQPINADEKSIQKIFTMADEALYQAKSLGKNRVFTA